MTPLLSKPTKRNRPTLDIRATGTGGGSKTLNLSATLQIEARSTDPAAAQGVRKFTMTAYNGGPMNLAGYFAPVVVDLGGIGGIDKTRPIFRNHDADQLVGHATKIQVEGTTLKAEGVVSGAGPAATEVLAAHDNGFPWQASIGARVLSMEFVKAGATTTANGKEFAGPINVARKTVLGEISFVPLGADDSTSARIAATHAATGATMDFEQWLKAKGFTLGELDDAQRASLEAIYNAEKNGGDKGDKSKGSAEDQLNVALTAAQAQEAEKKKIADLTVKALNDHKGQLPIIQELSKQAFNANWDALKFELELLRALRPQAPGIIRGADGESLTDDVYVAALCLSGGLEKPEKQFNERTLDAAQKRFKHGLGVGELLMIFARRNGHDAYSTRQPRPLLEAAFAKTDPQITASGISTISLPNILSTVANRFLKAGFDAVEDTWQAIASIRNVSDFRSVTSFSLTGDFEYAELPPGGEIQHGTVGETTYSNQAKTYARMFGIDRRDIINDDTNALTGIPKRLGRGAALKFNKVFWTAFMNNASFFSTGNVNFLSGVTVGTNDSRLNLEGLTRAEGAFLNQTDPDGQPIAVMPRILLVPNGLWVDANALMNSTEIRDTTANTKIGTNNPFAGKFSIVRSTYLSSAAITGNSTVKWYLLADPNDVSTIEAAFLNGVRVPTVESADLDFNTLGIQMRGYHDFGVSLQEFRGGVASKGAA